MRDINWYAETAKSKNNLKSGNQLAKMMGITSASYHRLTTSQSIPSDETMIKLAELAGIDPSIALIERSLWMSNGAPKKAYAKTLHILQHATLVLCLAIVGLTGLSGNAHAFKVSSDNNNSIYYGK